MKKKIYNKVACPGPPTIRSRPYDKWVPLEIVQKLKTGHKISNNPTILSRNI